MKALLVEYTFSFSEFNDTVILYWISCVNFIGFKILLILIIGISIKCHIGVTLYMCVHV